MKKIFGIILCLFVFCGAGEEQYTPTQNEWLGVYLNSYAGGFKAFDSSVIVEDKMVTVDVYYRDEKDVGAARKHLQRLSRQIALKVKEYPWAEDYKVVVGLYIETDPI